MSPWAPAVGAVERRAMTTALEPLCWHHHCQRSWCGPPSGAVGRPPPTTRRRQRAPALRVSAHPCFSARAHEHPRSCHPRGWRRLCVACTRVGDCATTSRCASRVSPRSGQSWLVHSCCRDLLPRRCCTRAESYCHGRPRHCRAMQAFAAPPPREALSPTSLRQCTSAFHSTDFSRQAERRGHCIDVTALGQLNAVRGAIGHTRTATNTMRHPTNACCRRGRAALQQTWRLPAQWCWSDVSGRELMLGLNLATHNYC